MNADTSRRNLLKIMSGAPLVPLSSTMAGASALLAGCGGSSSAVTPLGKVSKVTFKDRKSVV